MCMEITSFVKHTAVFGSRTRGDLYVRKLIDFGEFKKDICYPFFDLTPKQYVEFYDHEGTADFDFAYPSYLKLPDGKILSFSHTPVKRLLLRDSRNHNTPTFIVYSVERADYEEYQKCSICETCKLHTEKRNDVVVAYPSHPWWPTTNPPTLTPRYDPNELRELNRIWCASYSNQYSQ